MDTLPLDTLLARLRTRGWRLTPQRRAVAEALDGLNVHLTADEVLERAVAILPQVSRATVYNTLRELIEMGEVGEVTADGRSRRYDPNVASPHHHLRCADCGFLRDVHPGGVDAIRLPAEELHGFDPQSVEVVVVAACTDPVCPRRTGSPR